MFIISIFNWNKFLSMKFMNKDWNSTTIKLDNGSLTPKSLKVFSPIEIATFFCAKRRHFVVNRLKFSRSGWNKGRDINIYRYIRRGTEKNFKLRAVHMRQKFRRISSSEPDLGRECDSFSSLETTFQILSHEIASPHFLIDVVSKFYNN